MKVIGANDAPDTAVMINGDGSRCAEKKKAGAIRPQHPQTSGSTYSGTDQQGKNVKNNVNCDDCSQHAIPISHPTGP